MKNITLRPAASAADIAEIARLGGVIWREHYGPILAEGQVDYMLERFQSEAAIAAGIAEGGYQYRLICLDGRPVGYAGYVFEAEALFLSKLYLLREARGCGAGRYVMDVLRAAAAERGRPVIYLTVNRNNTGSIAFYEAMGFVKARTQVADIGGGYVMDDYIMELRVQEAGA